jgi:NADPH:quinone reductase-like Zn-dependent oxidoreductase
MKAMYLEKKTGPEGLIEGDLPLPELQAGEILVKVHATTVMPSELAWFPTFNLPSGKPRPFPIVLSHELSGEVAALGGDVKNFKIGDRLYGINDWFANGAQAEYCAVAATALAPMPASLNYAQSAAVPISALTAWQGLFDRTKLQRGQTILIHGAAGGVGTFAVQMAHGAGARVIATASAGNADFVRELGADDVIDYKKVRFEEAVKNVDVVFDGVGGDTLERSWNVLKSGGKLVTIVSQNETAPPRTGAAFMLVQADGSQLAQISRMIDAGHLRVQLDNTFPLTQVREAYARAQQGGLRGKITLAVMPS